MTEPTSPALEIALAYFHAWTGHDLDKAMEYIADDIVCDAPAGRLEGAAAYRGFMGPFVQILKRSELLAAFGDDQRSGSRLRHRDRARQERTCRRMRHRRRRQDHLQPVHLRPRALRRCSRGRSMTRFHRAARSM